MATSCQAGCKDAVYAVDLWGKGSAIWRHAESWVTTCMHDTDVGAMSQERIPFHLTPFCLSPAVPPPWE